MNSYGEKREIFYWLVTLIVFFFVLGCGNYRGLNEKNTYFQKAERARHAGKWDEAVMYYRKCLEFSPNSWSAHLQLALWAEEQKRDYPLAITHYQAYLDLKGPESDRVARLLMNLKYRYAQILIAECLGNETVSIDEKLNRREGFIRSILSTNNKEILINEILLTHKIAKGETPVSLAELYYGDRRYWRRILDTNILYGRGKEFFQEGNVIFVPLNAIKGQ